MKNIVKGKAFDKYPQIIKRLTQEQQIEHNIIIQFLILQILQAVFGLFDKLGIVRIVRC